MSTILRSLTFSTLTASLLAGGAAMAQSMTCSPTQPDGSIGPATATVGVVPEYCAPWTTGDAGQECVVNLGYDFGLKIDGWSPETGGSYSGACDGQGSCELAPEFNNTITTSNDNGTYFDWASFPFALGAVVVKGGPNANVFTYEPTANADSELYSPMNANNSLPYNVSHASFCWNKSGDQCYQDETAWGIGTPYNEKRNNWATYVAYVEGETTTVDVRADGGDGVGIHAGTATLEPSGAQVKITIDLDNTFIFYYDLNGDEEDNNLKVQDYASAPSGNPKPGRFAWKTFIQVGSTSGSVLVPVNNFYGIHLDLAYQVACQ